MLLLLKRPRERQSSLFPRLGPSHLPCFQMALLAFVLEVFHLASQISVPHYPAGPTPAPAPPTVMRRMLGMEGATPAGWSCPQRVSLPALVTAPPLLPLDPRDVEDALGLCCCFWSPAHCVSPLSCPHL